MWPRACDEHVDGLRGDVGNEHEERDPNDPQRAALAAAGDSAQLPDDHERRDDLNKRVQTEACKPDRARANGCRDHDDRADNVPGERRVLEP